MIPIQQQNSFPSFPKLQYPRTKRQLSHLGELTTKPHPKTHHQSTQKKTHSINNFKQQLESLPDHPLPNKPLDSKLDPQLLKHRIKHNLLVAQLLSTQQKEKQREKEMERARVKQEWERRGEQQVWKKEQKESLVKLSRGEERLKVYLCQKVKKGGKISSVDQEFLKDVCFDENVLKLLGRRRDETTDNMGGLVQEEVIENSEVRQESQSEQKQNSKQYDQSDSSSRYTNLFNQN